jgi:hypothetical protein
MDPLTISSLIISLEKLHERSTRLLLEHRSLGQTSSKPQSEIPSPVLQIEGFPNITRQTILWLTNAKQCASQLALEDVQRITGQCHRAFERIENLSLQLQDEDNLTFVLELSHVDDWRTKELEYRISLLEAMSLTLNAMMHAFHVAGLNKDS